MQDLFTASIVISSAQKDGDALILTLRGEIDLHNSPELRTDLLGLLGAQRPGRLILDLAQVPYMDSSALAVYVEALKQMRQRGGKIFLCGLQPRVKGLLEIARLTTVFVICGDVSEALGK
jgi:anti-sigma B factor antagonist